MIVARHVIHHVMDPHFLSKVPSYDMVSIILLAASSTTA